MNYTITFNPALDYMVKVNHFTPGMVNRTVKEDIYYGEKASMFQQFWQTWDMRALPWDTKNITEKIMNNKNKRRRPEI